MSEKPYVTERIFGWLKIGIVSAICIGLIGDYIWANVFRAEEEHFKNCEEFSRLRNAQKKSQLKNESDREKLAEHLSSGLISKFGNFIGCMDIVGWEFAGIKGETQEYADYAKKANEVDIKAKIYASITNEFEDAVTSVEGVQGAIDKIKAQATYELIATEKEVSEQELNVLSDAVIAGKWLLISGADQEDDAAIHQVNEVQTAIETLSMDLQSKAEKAQIYRIRSWLRTVVPFVSREAARKALDILQSKLVHGGYVRAKDDWCSSVVAREPIGEIAVSICNK
jgi:hypothetical protein